jgi:hypothetical protein
MFSEPTAPRSSTQRGFFFAAVLQLNIAVHRNMAQGGEDAPRVSSLAFEQRALASRRMFDAGFLFSRLVKLSEDMTGRKLNIFSARRRFPRMA